MTTKFNLDKSGHETKASLKRRIADMWGFQYSRIILLEAGSSYGIFDYAAFSVAGIGYSTDFETLERAEAFDDSYDC